MTALPVVAITLGDACGIGPEVVFKSLARADVRAECRPVIIGSLPVAERDRALYAPGLVLRPVAALGAPPADDAVELLDTGSLQVADAPRGRLSPVAGKAAAEFAIRAGHMAMAGQVDAIATAPLNKEAMRAGGVHYIGHTELYQAIGGNVPVATMLISGELRVVHVVQHASLAESLRRITRQNVLHTIRTTHNGMRLLGFTRPRLGICGLNPHNGEGGLMGSEEIDVIAPAVQDARAADIDARGPFAADSIFFRAVRGEFDCLVAMYHDQGHIAIKTYGFDQSITVTLGLPFIRTSADHGTAFDIAGQGRANAESMTAAIRLAATLARNRAAAA